tara:strand:+ start:1039 stop:1254 length:216 start_codon:yes stop_codon:yes gene_type:complete
MATKKLSISGTAQHKARMKALYNVTFGLLGSDGKPKPVKSGTSPSEDSAGIKKFRESVQKQYSNPPRNVKK